MNKNILKTLEAYLLTNREFLTLDEIADIEKQISYIKNEIQKEKMRAYVAQLESFKKHMADTFEKLMGGDDCTNESVDAFYRSDFEINWRGKTVTLANGAEVFQGLEEILWGEIDDCKEV